MLNKTQRQKNTAHCADDHAHHPVAPALR
jgi:hypothetical protein